MSLPTLPWAPRAGNPPGVVPLAEILESPELSFQLGNLGKNGQRLLQLSWQVGQRGLATRDSPAVPLGLPLSPWHHRGHHCHHPRELARSRGTSPTR